MTLTVSKLAAEVGIKADTVRYYEKAGMVAGGWLCRRGRMVRNSN
jgi:hypothetical protein